VVTTEITGLYGCIYYRLFNSTWFQSSSAQLIVTPEVGQINFGISGLGSCVVRNNAIFISSGIDVNPTNCITFTPPTVFRMLLGFDSFTLGYIQTGAKLLGSGYVGLPSQGYTVALASDGNTLAVGGKDDNNGIGATWIFIRDGSEWVRQGGKLVGTGYDVLYPPNQGSSLSLSTDGNTLAVGGRLDSNGIGATWIFTRSFTITGITWAQQGNKLVGTASSGQPKQGHSVDLSSDGNTLAVGGPDDQSQLGATWVFTRTNNTWSQQGNKLVGTGYTGQSRQGYSVSLSSDGNTLAIGGPYDQSERGATWVFTRSVSTWSQQGAKLTATDTLYVIGTPRQGWSVSLSGDGNTLVAGAPNNDSGIGRWFIFNRNVTTWTYNSSNVLPFDYFNTPGIGWSVCLSTDGSTLAVGGYDSNNNSIGGTWLFASSLGSYTQTYARLIGSDHVGMANEGYSVALSGNGITVAMGGPNDNSGIGATWIFDKLY
jgi:hypothetical protein